MKHLNSLSFHTLTTKKKLASTDRLCPARHRYDTENTTIVMTRLVWPSGAGKRQAAAGQ